MLSNVEAAAAARAATQILNFETLPDVARKFRRMAFNLAAQDFVMMLVAPDGLGQRFVPRIDGDYPGQSQRADDLAAALPDSFARRLATTSAPLWWSVEHGGLTAESCARLRWAERVAAPWKACGALVLPLFAERGETGMVAFLGDDMAATDMHVWDAHARALALFATVARLKPPGDGEQPIISRREVECLKLTAEGLTSEDIARKLGLSVHTTNQYLTSTTRKLNAVNRMHAVAKALRRGVIS